MFIRPTPLCSLHPWSSPRRKRNRAHTEEDTEDTGHRTRDTGHLPHLLDFMAEHSYGALPQTVEGPRLCLNQLQIVKAKAKEKEAEAG